MKILFVSIFMFTLFLASCSTCRDANSDEDQIHTLIKEASGLAEKHQLGDLMDLVAQDFSVQPRGWKRKQVKKTLFLMFYRLGDFSIHYPTPDIVIDPNSQEATATMIVLLIRKGESTPDIETFKRDTKSWLEKASRSYRLYRIRLYLKKLDQDWLVQKAGFETFRGLGFK